MIYKLFKNRNSAYTFMKYDDVITDDLVKDLIDEIPKAINEFTDFLMVFFPEGESMLGAHRIKKGDYEIQINHNLLKHGYANIIDIITYLLPYDEISKIIEEITDISLSPSLKINNQSPYSGFNISEDGDKFTLIQHDYIITDDLVKDLLHNSEIVMDKFIALMKCYLPLGITTLGDYNVKRERLCDDRFKVELSGIGYMDIIPMIIQFMETEDLNEFIKDLRIMMNESKNQQGLILTPVERYRLNSDNYLKTFVDYYEIDPTNKTEERIFDELKVCMGDSFYEGFRQIFSEKIMGEIWYERCKNI